MSIVKVNVTGLYQPWLILQYHTSDTAATLNVLGYFRPVQRRWSGLGKEATRRMVFLKLFLVLRRRAGTVSMNRFRPWDPSMTKEWKSATRAQIFNFWELPKAWEALLAFLLKPKASWSLMKISSNKNPTEFERKNKMDFLGTSVPTFRKCISSNKVCQLLSWSHLISSFIQQIYFLVGSLVHTLFRPDLRLVTQPRFHEHVKRSEYFWNFEIWPATVWLRNSVMTVFDLLALD